MRDRLNLEPKQVATVGSWAHFNAIVEHTEGKTFVNAGQEPLSGPEHQLLNALQTETSIPWDEMRHDAFTFQVAMAVLASNRPRVLYLALGETDDWAHDGRYDRVLEAYARSDRYLAQLWTWLESQPEYKGRTHVLITTDHGRGRRAQDWSDHGANDRGRAGCLDGIRVAEDGPPRRVAITRAVVDQPDRRDTGGMGGP